MYYIHKIYITIN